MKLLSNIIRFRLRRAKRSAQSGVAAVEMALIAPAFFLLLFGIVETGLMLAAQQLIDNAAYNASRLGSTGYVQNGEDQEQTVLQILDNELSSFGMLININLVTLTSVAYNDFANIGNGGGNNSLGTPDQIVVYTVTYPWKFFTPMIGQILGTWNESLDAWVVTLNSQIVVRNEPYGT